jgi:polar amino acid transport system substrate-binding protein
MTIKAEWTLALLLALTVGSATAAGVTPARQYSIGVEELQYYPLHTSGKNNAFSGYARDVLDAFARQQGYTFRFVPLPINRLYVAFLTEKSVDFKYPDNPKWKSELRAGLKVTYSGPLVTSEEGALVLPKNRGRALHQIKSLGTVLGFTPWPYLPAIEQKTLALTVDSGLDGLLRHALAGHIDAVYANVDVANYVLAEELKAPGGLVFDRGLPHARSDFSLSSLRHAQVLIELDAFLRREQPLLRQLRAKYKIEEHSPAPGMR